MQFKVTLPPYRVFDNANAQKVAYKEIFDNPTGRMVLQDIIVNVCGMGFDVTGMNERQKHERSGSQSVGMYLLKLLNEEDES